mmetsp:Transcript_17437/g.31645  ORF Transcript_17437/g.31645 Transcript_17437/m.31645 type:complete len:200 (-) Transcript_17437:489-1088(-)
MSSLEHFRSRTLVGWYFFLPQSPSSSTTFFSPDLKTTLSAQELMDISQWHSGVLVHCFFFFPLQLIVGLAADGPGVEINDVSDSVGESCFSTDAGTTLSAQALMDISQWHSGVLAHCFLFFFPLQPVVGLTVDGSAMEINDDVGDSDGKSVVGIMCGGGSHGTTSPGSISVDSVSQISTTVHVSSVLTTAQHSAGVTNR